MGISRKYKPLKDYLAENADTYQSMAVQDIVDTLNAKTSTDYRRMTVSELQEELAVIGKALHVATFLETTDEATAGLRRYVNMLLNGKQESFNLMSTAAQDMLDALISLGVLTAEDKAALEASVTETKSSMDVLRLQATTVPQIDVMKAALGWV